jgi:hypothetical protein
MEEANPKSHAPTKKQSLPPPSLKASIPKVDDSTKLPARSGKWHFIHFVCKFLGATDLRTTRGFHEACVSQFVSKYRVIGHLNRWAIW